MNDAIEKSANRIIWQYWETRDHKPPFIDLLYEIAIKNSGVEVIRVGPDTLSQYLPNIPDHILKIEEIAHKADMIRALLIYHYGGMWLDSDAIVLSNLNFLFDFLEEYEFVGFNDNGSFMDKPLKARINCFISRPKSKILEQWITAQHSKFPRTHFEWTEIGTQLLDPIVLKNSDSVKLLNFDLIAPIKYYEVDIFSQKKEIIPLLENSFIVMLSNKSLEDKKSAIRYLSNKDLIEGNTVISSILRKALLND